MGRSGAESGDPSGNGRHDAKVTDGEGGRADQAAELGELLFSLANVARTLGVDPESALRSRAATFRTSVEELG
jgi:uncharacterized protein YabN with tetrapyrrole methylase and pyrophosphatase domain